MTTPTPTPTRRLNVAIAGASGKMGRLLIEAVIQAPDLTLAGALDQPGSAGIGRDAGEPLGVQTGVTVQADVRTALASAEFLIDFTRPEGTLAHLQAAAERGVKMVIGTTGFDATQLAVIREATRRLAIVLAPNMGVGVNAMKRILEVAARLLDEGYDVEVVEAHHRHKVDAPSGTALWMGRTVAQATGRSLEHDAVYAREGHTGPRKDRSIGFSAIRGGDIIGEHTVMFVGNGERVEITHRSTSRASYVSGSLRAVRWLASREPGLYDMQDVLGSD